MKRDANDILRERGPAGLREAIDGARAEPLERARPNGGKDWKGRSREDLLLSAWLTRELPLRDYLLGNVFCTTSRWLIFGDTGVGKTLFAVSMAGAIAAAASFLGWEGKRRARVMYLDGEMPAETFKERMQLIAAEFGDDLAIFGYNRDVLDPDEMPPLNTPRARRGSYARSKPSSPTRSSSTASCVCSWER